MFLLNLISHFLKLLNLVAMFKKKKSEKAKLVVKFVWTYLFCFFVFSTKLMAQNDAFVISDSSLLENEKTKSEKVESKAIPANSDSLKPTVNRAFSPPTFAPTAVYKPKPIRPFTQETIYGIKLATDGWGVMYEKGKSIFENAKTSDKFYHVRYYQVEIQEHKNPKEHRENYPNPYIWNAPTKPYVYGKVNNFYALKLGYGNRKLIAGKPEPGTVSIHWSYSGGISLGLLKPYYLDVQIPLDTFKFGERLSTSIKYTEATKQNFLDKSVIVGHSSWAKGIDELSIVPGIQFKTALHFDFAVSKDMATSIETGVSLEYYSKSIQIMAYQNDKNYFISGYLAFQFGKRK